MAPFRLSRSPGLFGWVLNVPSLAVILLLVGYPILSSLWLSLHRYNLMRSRLYAFTGLENYADILQSPEFWSALRITAIFTVIAVAVIVVLGLAVALLLDCDFPLRNVVRAMILIPWAIPPVVNGLMWQWIYDPKIGALNAVLKSLGVIDDYQGWLSSPGYALGGLISAHVWNEFPVAAVLFMGALQRIPDELYDAARVDGARAWQILAYVTMPWLWQALLIVLILQTVLAMRMFDILYVLTAGGPGTATTTLTWQTYLTTFESLDFGHGSAYAYIIAMITLALTAIYFRTLYHRGEFEV